MRRALVLLAAVLLVPGCVDGTPHVERSASAAPRPPHADVSVETGGIEGYVVDEEQVPIPNATIEILGANTTTTSASNGAFAFDRLTPATYLLVVTHPSHVLRKKGVDVVSGVATKVLVILDPLPSPAPYLDEGFSFNGYISEAACAEAAGQMRCQMGSTGTAVPEDLRSENSSHLKLSGPWHSVLLELDWQAGSAAASELKLTMVVGRMSANSCAYGHRLVNVTGPAPLSLRLTRNEFNAMRAADPALCEMNDDAELYFEVNPWTAATASAFADQHFTVYGTVSHHAPIPDEYTRIP